MIDRQDAIRKLFLRIAGPIGLGALAEPIVGGIGAILMLHRVTAFPEKPDSVNQGLNIAPGFLDLLIQDMKERGYVFVSLDEAVSRIQAGGSSDRFATITLDDGYRDNRLEALPVFEKHSTPFTIYIAPALIDGAIDLWWEVIEDIVLARDQVELPSAQGAVEVDCSTPSAKTRAIDRLRRYLSEELSEEDQRAALCTLAAAAGIDPQGPRGTLMDWDEIRTIAAHPLVTIGAHTVHHYALRRLGDATARREIADVADVLERRLGQRPSHMAYPYGHAAAAGPREAAFAKEAGYLSAVTTRHGVIRPEHARHLHALPRISVNGRFQRLGYMRTMLSGLTTPIANRGRRLVTV
jgi:peptidoglycan/xylan/chitin deacetylase (PgdA/CDA1 family)